MKIKVKFISILIIINMLSIIVGMYSCMSNATEIKQSISTDITIIDENKYPGIRSKIEELKKQYPKWNFKILYTGINWNDAIKYEYTGHGSSPKNLVPINKNYAGAWVCGVCKDETYDSGEWKCASEEAIEYMMDPRNSLNSSDIFQFLELSYSQDNNYSKDAIKSMLKGSFLEDEKYTDTIISACKQYNVNPYYVVARIFQEQKKTGTTLTKGEGYNGQYVGYYNVFNIGAAGNGQEKVILNGLAKAKKNDWTSLEKSISGGIQIIASQYIAIGQNTMYLQKFDVDNTDGNMYWHQYMQNILAAQSEGEILKKSLSEINAVEYEYTFIIPVYENMPKFAAARPAIDSVKNNSTVDLVTINVTSSLKIRNAPAGTTTIGYLYAGEIVTRIEKATEKVNGTYWDKILNSNGVEGYVARCTYDGDANYKLYLMPLSVEAEEKVEQEKKKNETENDDTGNVSTEENVAIMKEEKEILKGDVNNDGKITSSDYVLIKNHIMGTKELTEEEKKYADYNEDGKITSSDYVLIKNYIMSK